MSRESTPVALPAEFIVNPHIVVSRKTWKALLEQIDVAEATPALRELMSGRDSAAASDDP